MQAVCDILEQLLHEGVLRQYVIGCAMAAGFHGEPLATRDIEVIVLLDPAAGQLLVSLSPVFSRLKELGFFEFEEEGLLVHGSPIQFICASPGLESEAIKSAILVEWENHRMRVIRPEHLAAMALSVGRPKDRARLVYLAELPNFEHSSFREILNRHGLIQRWQDWASALGLDP